jgi:hypothetical protein
VTLQPLTTGQLLDRTFSLYRQRALLFMAIAAAPHVVYFLGMTAFQAGIAGFFGSAGVIASVVTLIVFLIAYFALIGLSQAATAVAVSDVYLERPVTVGSAYTRVKGKTLRYFGIVFGVAILTGVGFILLIIPGIYFAITYALTLVISANEGLGWTAATRRSKDLVKGNRNRIAVIFLLSFVISYALAFGLAVPATMLAPVLVKISPLLANVVVLIAGFVANTVAGPIALIGFTLAYYDIRVRKEAFDLQLMMENAPKVAAAGQGA